MAFAPNRDAGCVRRHTRPDTKRRYPGDEWPQAWHADMRKENKKRRSFPFDRIPPKYLI